MNNDDPAVWLVDEFGAEIRTCCGIDVSTELRLRSEDHGLSLWIEYFEGGTWKIGDAKTAQPLTRDDVRRMCEIFGVEVQK